MRAVHGRSATRGLVGIDQWPSRELLKLEIVGSIPRTDTMRGLRSVTCSVFHTEETGSTPVPRTQG